MKPLKQELREEVKALLHEYRDSSFELASAGLHDTEAYADAILKACRDSLPEERAANTKIGIIDSFENGYNQAIWEVRHIFGGGK